MAVASYIFAVLALCGGVFSLLALIAARAFLAQKPATGGFAPPVSILKPLKGCDPEMYEAFRSHCLQDHPAFELIFGVSSGDDPAAPLVERLRQEFPAVRIELVVCSEVIGANRKVSNLAAMLRLAQHEFVLVNDSDIRVPSGYLAKVMAPFSDASVGLVTCLYRGGHGKARSLWSQLEALGIVADFMPGVLSARMLEGGVRFALGSTMAIRRSALEQIGGFAAVADHLADDYELGRRIAAAGHQVRIASVPVETAVPEYSLRDFFRHQLRWGRTVRSSRPAGHFALALTFGFFWATLAVIASGATGWGLGLWLVILLLRLIVAVNYGRLLEDAQARRNLLLLPLLDLLAPVVWAASIAGNTVHWRGEIFRLQKGRLIRR